jgi:hypothetical protein
MGYFKELDVLIQDKAKYNPDTRENEHTYLQLKDEIEAHISGILAIDQLSPIAQDVLKDWESIVAEHIEQPEDC